MTTAEIAKKAQAQAEGGLDIHTIRTDAEVRLGRKLDTAEAQALQDGWRAAAPKRHERYRRSQQNAADQRRNAGSR